MAVLLTGIAEWASPLVLVDLLTRGFYWETAIASGITALLMSCVVGFLKQGFYRYLSFLISSILLGGMVVFLLGFELYSWIFLSSVQSLSGLMELAFLRYQEPELWHLFLTVEGIVFILTFLAIALYLFHWLKPNNKALGNAHFSNGFETKRLDFSSVRIKASLLVKNTVRHFTPTALNMFWFLRPREAVKHEVSAYPIFLITPIRWCVMM